MSWTIHETPIGPLTLEHGEAGLRGLSFPGESGPLAEAEHRPEAFADVARQLDEYFAGSRREFAVELDLRGGTPFQQAVWDALREIPFGETVSYTELAARIGRPDRLRPVAATVGRTPIPIIVPCHRVIGADGSLTGYGGGLHRKAALLDLEARVSAGASPEPAWAFRQLTLA
jgi:methylated-DNA-[protein]-cysteine S-methyltransferase